MKKNKFSVKPSFIIYMGTMFAVNLAMLIDLRITNDFRILILSIINLSTLILFIITIGAIDIYFYFKTKKLRNFIKCLKEQDECYKNHLNNDKPKFSKKSIEKLTKKLTNGCFFVINPAYDEKDLSSKRYVRMSFSSIGNKIDEKTVKAEYSDHNDFRKNKSSKWYINLFKKLMFWYDC